MGGYAGFVWSSYGVTAVVLGGLFVSVWLGLRRDERTLARLQAALGGRRRGRAEQAEGADPSPAPHSASARPGPAGITPRTADNGEPA
nr:heme exporter protein CcmD [Roseospira visakhapatnamensis]